MAKNNTFHSLITFLLFAALCGVGYLWYSGQLGPRAEVIGDNLNNGSEILKTEVQFRDKLEELKMQRDKVQRGLARLERLKAENIEHLKDKGVNSGQDFLNSSDKDIKNAVVNLKEWVKQIDKTKKEITYYDDAITNIRTMLDKIERERINESISLSEDEYVGLQKIIVDLNERLNVDTNILEDEELGKLLDLEMVGSGNE